MKQIEHLGQRIGNLDASGMYFEKISVALICYPGRADVPDPCLVRGGSFWVT